MLVKWNFPTNQQLDQFLIDSGKLPFNYQAIGQSEIGHPKGYDLDFNQTTLGEGNACFEQAKKAIKAWQMFQLPWVKLYSDQTLIQEGALVSVNFCLFGLWWSNSCEIVYVIDEPNRFGFAYGTKDHVESGEELFLVSKDEQGKVTYTIRAYSRPKFWLVKLGYPFARYCQRKFAQSVFKN